MQSHVAVVRDWVCGSSPAWSVISRNISIREYNPAVHGNRQVFFFTNSERSEF